MSTVALHLTIELAHGKPVSLARLADPDIFRTVTGAAVSEAGRKASRARFAEATPGRPGRNDAAHLKRYLNMLVPGLQLNN